MDYIVYVRCLLFLRFTGIFNIFAGLHRSIGMHAMMHPKDACSDAEDKMNDIAKKGFIVVVVGALFISGLIFAVRAESGAGKNRFATVSVASAATDSSADPGAGTGSGSATSLAAQGSASNSLSAVQGDYHERDGSGDEVSGYDD